jgi:hypothetical protein
MRTYKRVYGLKRLAAVGMLGTAFAFGGCDLGEFTSTSTITLSGREVMTFLARSWILTPIQTAIDNGIDAFFDRIEDEND